MICGFNALGPMKAPRRVHLSGEREAWHRGVSPGVDHPTAPAPQSISTWARPRFKGIQVHTVHLMWMAARAELPDGSYTAQGPNVSRFQPGDLVQGWGFSFCLIQVQLFATMKTAKPKKAVIGKEREERREREREQ